MVQIEQAIGKAMKTGISTLIELKAWRVVSLTPDMNVLDSTWAFKCTNYPDGNIRKFEAKFFCRGDQKVYGVDYFDTFAPVVSWTIVRMLLEPPVIFGLDMKQGDYTVPFFMYLLQKMYMLECLEVFKKKGKFSNWKGRFRNYIDPQGTSLNSSR